MPRPRVALVAPTPHTMGRPTQLTSVAAGGRAEADVRRRHGSSWRATSRTLSSMSASDKRKQSLYFPEEMLKEIAAEATRQDRSLSWIMQQAWKGARKDISS